MTSDLTIYTIGHSNHSIDRFLELLHQYGIDIIFDVRSYPYSKRFEHFHKDTLYKILKKDNIAYQFLGKELGGRSDDPSCLNNGKVSYELLAQRKEFLLGIEYILKNIGASRISLMCSEGDPLRCHRTILIARHLVEAGMAIEHILPNGETQSQKDCEEKLLHIFNQSSPSLFASSEEERVDEVYTRQAEKSPTQ